MKSSVEKLNKKLKSVNKKLKRLFVQDYESLVELKKGHYIAYEPHDSTTKNVLKRFRLERELAKLTVLNKLAGYQVENLWYNPIYVGNMDEAITQTAEVTYDLGKIRNKRATLELVFPLAGSGNTSFEWDSTIFIARLFSGKELIQEVSLRLIDEYRSLLTLFGERALENTKLNLILFADLDTPLYPLEALKLVDDYVSCFSRVEQINVEEPEDKELPSTGKVQPLESEYDKRVTEADMKSSVSEMEDLEEYEEDEEDLEFYSKLHKQARSSPKKSQKNENGKRYRSNGDINRLINRKRRVL
mgnify:CR=1 FL=1|jgi:hypothetical protein